MEEGLSSGSQSSGLVQTTATAQEEGADEEQENSSPCEQWEKRESVSTCSSGFWVQDVLASFEMQLADQYSLDSLVGFYLLPDILGGVLLIFESYHHATAEAAGVSGLGTEERKQVVLYLWLFATALTWFSLLLSFPFVVLAVFPISDGFKVHLISVAIRVLALTFGASALSMVQKGFLGAQVLILLMSMAMYRVMCMKLSTMPTKIASEVDVLSNSPVLPPESSMGNYASSSCAGLSKRADSSKD